MPRDNLSAVDFDRGTGDLYRMTDSHDIESSHDTARYLGFARLRNTEPEGISDET